MTSYQAQKIPTISEWDSKYKLPQELCDLLAVYDSHTSQSTVRQNLKNEKKNEGAETSENYELASLTLKENFNPNYYQLKEAIRFEEWIQKALNGVIQNAKDYEANIKQIDDIKSSVIEKINKFYEESSVLLEQQKVYVDTGVHVQSILSYFQDYEKLEKDIENLSLNIANIHIYEPNLQRFLSEIMDAIEFFQSKPNYKNSQEFQDKYDKLKRKLLSIIKSMFIKIFTRDYAEVNKEMERFQYEKLEVSNKDIIVNRDKNKELMMIIYPEFVPFFTNQHNYDILHNVEGRYLNKNLRNLLSYLHLLTRFDFDCVDTLNDLFGSYYGTFRKTLQGKVLENVVNQLHRIQPKELQVVVRKTVSFVLQITFFEMIYHNYFFNNTIQFTESSLIGVIINHLLEKYYEYVYSFIQIEHELKNFFEAIDALNYYISPMHNLLPKDSNILSTEESARVSDIESDEITQREKNFIEGIFKNVENEEAFKNLLSIQKKLKDEDGTNFQKYMELFINFLKRIRGDINIKLFEKIQSYVNNYIGNFNLNQYWKEFNQKYNSNPHDLKKNDIYKSPFFRTDMKTEIFPLAKTACELLFNLKNRTDRKAFQSIYNQIITITANNIYLASELFLEKTDSFLFLLKNFIFLVDKLEEYSIRLKIDDENGFNKVEAGLFEKIVMNVSIFGGRKVSQKMLEFSCDLKMEPFEHLEKISERFVEDIEFIISIKLVEYLNRYRYLESHINDGYQSKGSIDKVPSIEEVSSEKEQTPRDTQNKKPGEVRKKVEADAVKKEMESMLSKDMVKKYYLMFTHNMEDILEDLSNKMTCFLNPKDFNKILKLIEIIINNLMDMLSQFYVLISKHYSEEEYNDFNFIEIDKFKQKLHSFFVSDS